jgi:hypothetical protein
MQLGWVGLVHQDTVLGGQQGLEATTDSLWHDHQMHPGMLMMCA